MVDLDSIPNKLNWQLIVIQVFGIFIYIGFHIMLTLYKFKHKKSVAPIKQTRHGQSQYNNLTIESREIADFASNLFGLLFLGSIPIYLSMVTKISLSKVSEYPNYYILHFSSLILPSLITGSICVVYYARNKQLRLSVIKELVNFLNRFNFLHS